MSAKIRNVVTLSSPSDYGIKDESYFSGARRSFVDELPVNQAGRLLEIGCGAGGTAAYALHTEKCGWCCGVELCDEPAALARKHMDQVIVGNVENLDLPFPPGYFDAVIISEVLEHLVDPWTVLRRIRRLMREGAFVIAGSPNVAHFHVFGMLLQGDWRHDKSGPMDGTHLRWFTPKSYRRMFEDCGFDVVFVRPAVPLRWRARTINAFLMGRATHLFARQIVLKAAAR